MSTGFAIGMVVLALNVGFLAGAWWASRTRDIMADMEDEIQASTDRMLDRKPGRGDATDETIVKFERASNAGAY